MPGEMARDDSPFDVRGAAGLEVDHKVDVLPLVKGLFGCRRGSRDKKNRTGKKQYQSSAD
jgi:hypothetical protein